MSDIAVDDFLATHGSKCIELEEIFAIQELDRALAKRQQEQEDEKNMTETNFLSGECHILILAPEIGIMYSCDDE